MKGVVFCEFLEMVDTKMSIEMTEKIISKSNLPSGGAYTSVGTYDHREIVTLVKALSEETGIPVPELVYTFGRYLFSCFYKMHGETLEEYTNAFSLLESVDSYIHMDVKKIHPDAELPSIGTERLKEDKLILIYESSRSMGDLAHGLIQACIDHFGEDIALRREDLSSGSNQHIRFELIHR